MRNKNIDWSKDKLNKYNSTDWEGDKYDRFNKYEERDLRRGKMVVREYEINRHNKPYFSFTASSWAGINDKMYTDLCDLADVFYIIKDKYGVRLKHEQLTKAEIDSKI